MVKKRLSSEARRKTIIDAARGIFGERGFHGTTTRQLAKAASVSEALLFKHFPSKAAIYKAMLSACRKSETWSEAYRLLELEPSTATLAAMLHFIATRIVFGNEETRADHRLILRSLSEDGEYARVIYQHVGSTWIAQMNACVQSAQRAGDMRKSAFGLKSGDWLAQHLFMMLAFTHAPDKPVVRYNVPQKSLVEEAVVFCLRGLGVKDEAIQTHYNPAAFGLFSRR
jgi:AcrR family transcriptional regulator